jgi:pimeloyl-ACP methyl ester carboxylesterase
MIYVMMIHCEPNKKLTEDVYIRTFNTELFARIRGDSINSPIILYLHGGPANPLGDPIIMEYSGHQLEKQFIVVYLYQRGVGKSPTVTFSSQKFENYITDINYVINYLRKRYSNQKLNIIGHSYGGVLAYYYLTKHDDKISKLISVCAAFKFQYMMDARYKMTVQWAKEIDNQEAITSFLLMRKIFL